MNEEPRQYKILLIEDDPFVRDLYGRALVKSGFETIIAENGVDGIQKVRENSSIDLILLDIMMPQKTGIDVLTELKASESVFRHIPIVLLTNLGQETIIRKAMDMGVEGYLLKARYLPHEAVAEIESYLKTGAFITPTVAHPQF